MRTRPFRAGVVALVAATAVVSVGSGSTVGATENRLPGWQHDRLAQGVDLYQRVIAGNPGFWTATVRVNGSHLTSDPDALVARLRAAGFEPRVERWNGLRVRIEAG